MIEIQYHSPSTCIIHGATPAIGKQLGTIPNREYVRKGHKWIIPLSRIGDVYRLCGVVNVSIDYAVLEARDEQLRRMVADYARCGIRIWMRGGELVTDNETLTAALRPITKLLAPLVGDVEPPRIDEIGTSSGIRRIDKNNAPRAPENGDKRLSLESWLIGVKNAVESEERERDYPRIKNMA